MVSPHFFSAGKRRYIGKFSSEVFFLGGGSRGQIKKIPIQNKTKQKWRLATGVEDGPDAQKPGHGPPGCSRPGGQSHPSRPPWASARHRCPLAPRVGPDCRLGWFTSGDKSLPPPLGIMYRFPIAFLKTVGPRERGEAPGPGVSARAAAAARCAGSGRHRAREEEEGGCHPPPLPPPTAAIGH